MVHPTAQCQERAVRRDALLSRAWFHRYECLLQSPIEGTSVARRRVLFVPRLEPKPRWNTQLTIGRKGLPQWQAGRFPMIGAFVV